MPETEPVQEHAPQTPPEPERFDDKVLPLIGPVPITRNDWALIVPCRLVLTSRVPKFAVTEAEFSVPGAHALVDSVTLVFDRIVE